MRARCPHCGFEGTIRDDLIPEGGRTIACPKCKGRFFVGKSGGIEGPSSGGSGTADGPRAPAAGPPRSPRPAAKKTSPFLIIIMAVLFLALGFFGGYQYRVYTEGKYETPSGGEKKKAKGPKKPNPATGPKRDRDPLMTPMGEFPAGVPRGDGGGRPGSYSEGSYTADALFEIFSTMPPGQVRNFCRKNNTADVNGKGTIREITKTTAADGVIGDYSISIQCGADTWVILTAKMTDNYLSNFSVGNPVGFVGTLTDYTDSGKEKTIYLSDGMIVIN